MRAILQLWRWGWDFIALAGGIAVALSLCGEIHPAFDTLAQFRAHIAAVTVVAATVRILAGRGAGRVLACVVLAVAVYGGSKTVRFMVPDPSERAAGSETYTLLQFNARHNHYWLPILLKRVGADFVALQEFPPERVDADPELTAIYPHRAACDRTATGRAADILLLSKRPFAREPFCEPQSNFVRVTVLLDDRPVTIGSHHLDWPWPYGQGQNLAINVAALRDVEGAVILSGDFNAVPWSLTVRRYAALTHTVPTPGIGPTWLLNGSELAWRHYLGLPIDNILTSGITVTEVRRLEDHGSDHVPVLMRFALDEYEGRGAIRRSRSPGDDG